MTSMAVASRTMEGMERIIAAPVLRPALGALASRRSWSELAYCAAGLPLSVAGFVLVVALLALDQPIFYPADRPRDSKRVAMSRTTSLASPNDSARRGPSRASGWCQPSRPTFPLVPRRPS